MARLLRASAAQEAADGCFGEEGLEPLLLYVTDAGADRRSPRTAVGPELHGLVDNAGIAIAAPLELVPLDEFRRQLEVNVVGQVAVLQAFLPALRRGRGRVVLMGSVGGRSALPFLGPYAASKHALEAFADVLRIELAPVGDDGLDRRARERQDGDLGEGRRAGGRVCARRSPTMLPTSMPRGSRGSGEVALKRGPGIDPDVVARAVEHALTASRPKARYLVGRDAHLRAWIERLPTRLRDRVLARALLE